MGSSAWHIPWSWCSQHYVDASKAEAMAEATAKWSSYRMWAQHPRLKPEFPLGAETQLEHPHGGGRQRGGS